MDVFVRRFTGRAGDLQDPHRHRTTRAPQRCRGWAPLAEQAGIAALTLHGRTRADLYTGQGRVRRYGPVKAELKIPVIANGDIDSPESAPGPGLHWRRRRHDRPGRASVLDNPEIDHYLRTGASWRRRRYGEMRDLLLEHLDHRYRFYGEHTGVRTARAAHRLVPWTTCRAHARYLRP